jgi:4'-phosphopantetheinyl transferase
MPVYWLEQNDRDVPRDHDWLSLAETANLTSMRFPKRQADWRLGRWTAKRALACCLGLTPDAQTLAQIEIRPTSSGAPEVFIARRRQTLNLSLSHCSGRALCAVSLSGSSVGCDLELAEARHEAFLTDYFTPAEQCFVRNNPTSGQWRVLALLWSAKESALKALQIGLRLDTRLVVVSLSDPHASDSLWQPLLVSCPDEMVFVGSFSTTGDFVRTIVTTPPRELLVQVKPANYHLQATRPRSIRRVEEMYLVR